MADEDQERSNERRYRTLRKVQPAALEQLLTEADIAPPKILDVLEAIEGSLGELYEDADVQVAAKGDDAAIAAAVAYDEQRALPDGVHVFVAVPERNWTEVDVPVKTERKIG